MFALIDRIRRTRGRQDQRTLQLLATIERLHAQLEQVASILRQRMAR